MGHLIRYLASLLPFPYRVRSRLYRLSGMRIGSDVYIDRDLQVTDHRRITIGDRVTIAKSVSLLANIRAVHSRLETELGLNRSGPILIEDDAWIGVKATILPGVRIGRMATVGANTLVTADVPDHAVVVGVPGRVVLRRDQPGREGNRPCST